MRNLLQDADRDRLVAPLASLLAGEVGFAGRRFRALAAAEGSALFPLAENAQAVELLLLPGLREAHAGLADGMLDLVMALAEAEPPCRRAVSGRIEVLSEDPRRLELVTPFYRFTGNLARGELRQETTEGERVAVRHTGNLVEFRIGHRRACVDVEENIADCAVERVGNRVLLRHAGTIRGQAGLFAPRAVEAGLLTVEYEVAPDSPVLAVTVRFTAARRLGRARVSTAVDGLDEFGLGATAARLRGAAGWQAPVMPRAPGTTRWASGAPVEHLALGREGWSGPALHLRPRDPGRVMSVTAEARQSGAVHWLVLRHGPAALVKGATLTVREERLLAPGGAVETAAAAMQDGAAGLEPALAPSGAALRAAATALLLDLRGAWRDPLPAGRRAVLQNFTQRHAARFEACAAATAELAHAAIGADALRRAGDTAATGLQARLVGPLAARLDSAGRLAAPGEAPALATQALGLLAFTRAASWPDGGAAALALAAAMEPLGAGGRLTFDGREIEAAAEAEGVALLARAAGAAVLAAECGAALPTGAADRARQLHRAAVNLLRPLVRPRAGLLEVAARGGLAAAPQALATLALLAPDRLALAPQELDRASA